MSVMKIKKMILGSLFKKPATLMYPVVPRKFEERTRGHIEIDMDACILCGICAKRCPTDAIEVDRKEARSWGIDRLRCIQCNWCVEYCPKKCLYMKNEYSQPSVGQNKDVFYAPEKPEATAAAAGDEA